MNLVRLNASLVSRSDLRYTPAGIAVLEVGLQHDGAVVEASVERQLQFETAAVVLGEAALRLDRLALGSMLSLAGFLAPRSRKSRSLIIHITDYEIASQE